MAEPKGSRLMPQYVLDNSTISQIYLAFYKDRFPSFWLRFDGLVASGRATSVRAVEVELNRLSKVSFAVQELKRLNRDFFSTPTSDEQNFVARIFGVQHFRSLIDAKAKQMGREVADPYIIAKAGASMDMCVVTEEKFSPNAARIPNVCEHFGIACINLEGLMEREGWQF